MYVTELYVYFTVIIWLILQIHKL